MKEIVITCNDKPVLRANIGISISADPSLRFFFTPDKEGLIKTQATDSKGMKWIETFAVKASSSRGIAPQGFMRLDLEPHGAPAS